MRCTNWLAAAGLAVMLPPIAAAGMPEDGVQDADTAETAPCGPSDYRTGAEVLRRTARGNAEPGEAGAAAARLDECADREQAGNTGRRSGELPATALWLIPMLALAGVGIMAIWTHPSRNSG